jgi:hypothetical protein
MKLNKKLINLFGAIVSFRRSTKIIKYKRVLKRNKNLLREKKSDICYICGLGPSINKFDLNKIEDDIIVTNRFNRIQGNCISPRFYCLFDSGFFVGDGVNDFIQSVDMYPETNFILNGLYKNDIEKLIKYRENTYYTFNWKGVFNKKVKLDFTKVLPISENVIIYALQLAIYLNYKKIYLIGCDFNSFASKTMNHGYHDSIKERKWSLDFELFSYAFAANTHKEIREYANNNDIEIINLSEGSLLDAYEFGSNKKIMRN